jgi:hypothetical protein
LLCGASIACIYFRRSSKRASEFGDRLAGRGGGTAWAGVLQVFAIRSGRQPPFRLVRCYALDEDLLGGDVF